MTRFAFSRSRRRHRFDDAVPMINVAFLLLIFFLLAARVEPPEPLDVILPEVDNASASNPASEVLYLSLDGTIAFGDLRGEAVFGALHDGPVTLRADRSLDATELAAVLDRLHEAGVHDVSLAVLPGP